MTSYFRFNVSDLISIVLKRVLDSAWQGLSFILVFVIFPFCFKRVYFVYI